MDLKDGGTTAAYSWGQTQNEVNVYVQVPKFTKAQDIFVRINPNTLTVKLKAQGAERTIVDGGLFRAVSVDESTWMLEGSENDVVHVYLEKSDSDIMWSSVIQGDVDTDTGKNLLSAAREGRASDMVRLLRDRGADVNFQDAETGFTALHWAAACGQLEALGVLLELSEGVDVNKRDKDNNTPLLVAVQNLQTKAALALLEAGGGRSCDVQAVNAAGGSALMLAAATGEITLVRELIRLGAQVNAVDCNGFTAAMHASRLGSSSSIVMLIQEGNADLSLRSNEGKTAREYAADQPTADTLAENSIFLQAHGRQFI